MIPHAFPECNITFTPPEGLDESQVMSIAAFTGGVKQGSIDGVPITVVAWTPTEHERKVLALGNPIYLTFIGGLPPHYPSTSFEEATHPA